MALHAVAPGARHRPRLRQRLVAGGTGNRGHAVGVARLRRVAAGTRRRRACRGDRRLDARRLVGLHRDGARIWRRPIRHRSCGTRSWPSGSCSGSLLRRAGSRRRSPFLLFRIFDAAKPGPVAWADQLFKHRRGQAIGWRQGFGILFDDFVAALCALLVIALWKFVAR